MDHYEHLEKAMCRELEKLDKKYTSDPGEMSPADLDTADKIYHALKSAATYHAMKDAEEEPDEGISRRGRSYRRSYDGMSGYRGRSPATGRYVSRDPGYPMNSYDPYWDGPMY